MAEDTECDCRTKWFELLQPVAIFLIVLGVMTTWMGDHENYPELKTLGAGIAGAGIQKITSAVHSSLTTGRGSTLNVGTPPAPPDAGTTASAPA